MQRELTFEYAVSFARQNLTEAWVSGEAYRMGTITKYFDGNEKARMLSSRAAFIQVDAKNKIISSIMEGVINISEESKKEVIFIRLADISGVEEEAGLSFDRAITAAYEVNLKGDILREIPMEKGKVSVLCKAHKITTVAIIIEIS